PWDDDPSEDKNIWTKRQRSQQSRKNMDNLIDDLLKRLKEIMSGGGGGGDKQPFKKLRMGFILGLAVALTFVFWVFNCFYRVDEGQVGVVLRFGEMVHISGPGLQFRISPIETVALVQVASVNRIDGGIKQEGKNDTTEQTLILTGDENMVHTNYTVLWKIKDVSEFLFTARHPEMTIQAAAESCIREVIGQTQARLALTEGRDAIAAKAQELLQKIMNDYKIGVQIISLQLRKVEAPLKVIEAFNDVQASLIDADRSKNEAEAYRNDILPRARGEAEKIIQEAEAYRQQMIYLAQGEAARFNQVYQAYLTNPYVTQRRYYFEAMQQVLAHSHKILVDGKIGKDIVSYLPLNELTKSSQKKAK
ncbi:MAG: FtsH protease activity modulator HflK, partial [Proteobacteria bacterium]|nr:FtsH protease activity modulator HflK [Pseudomonadota bacterium]